MLFQNDLGTLAAGANAENLDQYWTEFCKAHPYPRLIKFACLSGGTAAGDSAVEIYTEGGYKLLHLENNSTDEAMDGDDHVPVDGFIPAGESLLLECSDAFAADCHMSIVAVRTR